MKFRVIQVLALITVFSFACFCTLVFWAGLTAPDRATEVWVHQYLRDDNNVDLNYRPNESMPHQAKVSFDSRLLPMVSQLESIEGLVVCYTKLNMGDFKCIGRMKNLKHLLIYGDYQSPYPGYYDPLLDIFCELENLETLQLGGASFLFTKEKLVSSIESSNVKRFFMHHTSADYIKFVSDAIREKYDNSLGPNEVFFVPDLLPPSNSTGSVQERTMSKPDLDK